MSFESRMLLALFLTGGVFLLAHYYFKLVHPIVRLSAPVRQAAPVLRASPSVEPVQDFGALSFAATPLRACLKWTNDRLLHNYGWSIVAVSFALNLLLLPLRFIGMKSMRKMQDVQPQLDALNRRYKDMRKDDPRRAQQSREMAELFRKHGVNPMLGCLPALLPLPFALAFYKVLSSASELRGARWLWVADLSGPESLPLKVLPLALVATQLVLVKLTPAGAPPAQQASALVMALVMGGLLYFSASGLVLYWVTSNVAGIGQQWLFSRMYAIKTAGI